MQINIADIVTDINGGRYRVDEINGSTLICNKNYDDGGWEPGWWFNEIQIKDVISINGKQVNSK